MPNLDDLIVRAERTAEAAHALLRATRLCERWEARGAEVHLVGSLATGLLLRHLDIDLHVYTPTLDPADGLRDSAAREWQVDVIQMPPDSPYKGYFEHRAERIRAVLTPETRRAILALKDAIPPEEHVPGILIYMAVLRDNIRDLPAFRAWLRDHPLDGILDWCP